MPVDFENLRLSIGLSLCGLPLSLKPPPPHPFAPPSPKTITTIRGHLKVSPGKLFSLRQTSSRIFTCPQAKLTPHVSTDTPTNTF